MSLTMGVFRLLHLALALDAESFMAGSVIA